MASSLRVHALLHSAATTIGKITSLPQAQSIVSTASSCDTLGAFLEWALNGACDLNLSALSLATLAEVFHLARISASSPVGPPATQRHIVSFDALARARTTLEDFTRFYLPLHGLPREDFFRFLPTLVYVEACIYQMDEENENCTRRLLVVDSSSTTASTSCAPVAWSATPTGAALRGVLEARGLLSARVLHQLCEGETYWCAERMLCAAMAAGGPVDLASVWACSGRKSFDYRTLHELLCALAGLAPPSDILLAFLTVDEILTDTADDLFDYEKVRDLPITSVLPWASLTPCLLSCACSRHGAGRAQEFVQRFPRGRARRRWR